MVWRLHRLRACVASAHWCIGQECSWNTKASAFVAPTSSRWVIKLVMFPTSRQNLGLAFVLVLVVHCWKTAGKMVLKVCQVPGPGWCSIPVANNRSRILRNHRGSRGCWQYGIATLRSRWDRSPLKCSSGMPRKGSCCCRLPQLPSPTPGISPLLVSLGAGVPGHA